MSASATPTDPHEPLSEEAEKQARLLYNQYNTDDKKRRNRKATAAVKSLFCKALLKGVSVTQACEALDISTAAMYYQREQDTEFAEAWADAIQKKVGLFEDRLFQLATEGNNPIPVLAWLRRLDPEAWLEQHQLKVEQRVTHDVVLPALPERQLLELVKAQLESGIKVLPPPPDKGVRADVTPDQRVRQVRRQHADLPGARDVGHPAVNSIVP